MDEQKFSYCEIFVLPAPVRDFSQQQLMLQNAVKSMQICSVDNNQTGKYTLGKRSSLVRTSRFPLSTLSAVRDAPFEYCCVPDCEEVFKSAFITCPGTSVVNELDG